MKIKYLKNFIILSIMISTLFIISCNKNTDNTQQEILDDKKLIDTAKKLDAAYSVMCSSLHGCEQLVNISNKKFESSNCKDRNSFNTSYINSLDRIELKKLINSTCSKTNEITQLINECSDYRTLPDGKRYPKFKILNCTDVNLNEYSNFLY